MSYLPALLALAAALIGIRGASKWNDKTPGVHWWKRITIAGWLAALLAILSATLSLVEAQKATEIKLELDREKQSAKRLAYRQLHDALGQLLDPFVFLMSGDCRSDDLVHVVDCASKTEFLERLGSISVMDRPDPLFLPRVENWAAFIGTAASRADDKLESVSVQFRSELGVEATTNIDSLRESGQLTILMSVPSMVVLNQQNGGDPRKLTLQLAFLGPREPEHDYLPFMRTVRSLLVEADAAIAK